MSFVRCLSFHASYRCQRAGACCTSSWPIPVEADRLARLRAAAATGVLRAAAPDGSALFTFAADAPPDTPAMLGVVGGRCVFFDDGHGHSCRVQELLGHDALPLACRQFPRVSVRDPRGVSVTLSAYCPTVARLLDSTQPVAIVESPAAFPAGGEYVGLDARTTLPPMLSPDRLMDWDSWWAWERHSVDVLAHAGGSAADALSKLRIAVEDVRSWTPSDEPLIERIANAFGETRDATWVDGPVGQWVGASNWALDVGERCREVDEAIPDELRPNRIPRAGLPPDHVVRRFLASHAFANWTMHLGQGLKSWLRSIEAAYALLQSGLDVREADLRLRHLADPIQLVKIWERVEVNGPVRQGSKAAMRQ